MQVTFILIWLWASAAAACALDCWETVGKDRAKADRIVGATIIGICGPFLIPFLFFYDLLMRINSK